MDCRKEEPIADCFSLAEKETPQLEASQGSLELEGLAAQHTLFFQTVRFSKFMFSSRVSSRLWVTPCGTLEDT